MRRRWVILIAVLTAAGAVAGIHLSRLADPAPSLLVLDQDGEYLSEYRAPPVSGPTGSFPGRGYWTAEPVPERVAAATVAIEDRRIRWHPGVDPVAVVRAVLQNIRTGRRVSGASTLAMQLARLQHPAPRTYWNKIRESLTAVAITIRHGRTTVLAQYLRLAPYGNQIHGIGLAARLYLDKPVSDLSWAEIAFLSAIPQAPGRMNPFTYEGRRRAVKRGRRILDRLKTTDVITESEYDLALDQLNHMEIHRRCERPGATLHAVFAMEPVLADYARDAGRRTPVIRTALSLPLQRAVESILEEHLADWPGADATNAAVLVLDTTGRIRIWTGSTGYFDTGNDGAIDYVLSRRAAGSTLKPFIYAMALDQDVIDAASLLLDTPYGSGTVRNADNRYLGPLLPRFALANSRNIPAVNLTRRLGLLPVYSGLAALGLHANTRPPDYYGTGLALGNLPVTLRDLTTAFTVFTRDGLLREPVWFEGQGTGAARRVMSAGTARQIALFLSDPMARLPSFPRMGTGEMPFPAAMKTGTSSHYRDAWTVMFTPVFTVGVWVGRPDHRPMKQVTGYRIAAGIARDILLRLEPDAADRGSGTGFLPPENYQAVRISASTGLRAGPATLRPVTEWFPRGEIPVMAENPELGDLFAGLPENAAHSGLDTGDALFLENLGPYQAMALLARLSVPAMNSEDTSATADATGVTITSPRTGTTVWIDPDQPQSASTLAFTANAGPDVHQLIWYVDGTPFAVSEPPFTVRWPLVPGRHRIHAEIFSNKLKSTPVYIEVR